jgi:electron transfer flavoprotein alpha/beta subunit
VAALRIIALVRGAADVALVRAGAALGEVVALAASPDGGAARALLAAARKAGARRLVRLWDPALDNADYLGLAWALAAATRAVADATAAAAPALLLAGDRGRGAVGPAVAERLGIPSLGQVRGVEARGDRVVARQAGRDRVRLLAAKPPLLLCLAVDEAPELPPLDEPGEDIEHWTLAKVGVNPAELGFRRRFLPTPMPGPTATPRRLPDVVTLATRLRADGVLVAPFPPATTPKERG